MDRLITLLRGCTSNSVWGHQIRANIDTNRDELLEQLRSQAQDEPAVMCRIVGIEATELLLSSKLEVQVRIMGVEYWKKPAPVVRSNRGRRKFVQ